MQCSTTYTEGPSMIRNNIKWEERTTETGDWNSRQGQTEDIITETEVVHALPGTDVTLVCSFPKPHTTYIIQTQWSKTDDNHLNTIAVYHPGYGIHYSTFPEASYNFSVSFSMRKCCGWDATEALCSPDQNITSECNQWALHLKNITVSLSGQYECSFVTYPYGTKAAKIQLIIKEEEEQYYVKEVRLNQTLEISCFEDTASENVSNYPLRWLVGGNGRKEELVTKEPSCPAVYRNSSMLYGQKVHLGLNHTLQIFPTKITDDGRVFSCHVLYHPERIQKSSTTVRVFAYPEISVSLQEGSAGTSQKPNVSCIVRKAFPKPSLVWYVDRVSLTEQPGDNRSNKASSEAFTTMPSEDLGNSALPSAVMTTSEHRLTSLESLDFTSQASLASASTTQEALISTAETKSYTITTTFNESLTTEGNLSFSITDQPISVPRGKDFFTTSNLINSTGSTRNTTASRFPWPTVVAILLLFCSLLIAVGIRKWCQYQKEIMNRPPSFKPPPPPIKYTSMVESDGTPPSCHELENL
ncbi:T-cell surface protein tactile isoform X4 [Cuculus canorus]|uniref:T-cell surface protein tactile isoform X4 n=1 Tax=Cuculus canorus TaxID=55661 RepID=UPI0023AA779C|nr:T-cell surface protein tactile isoform X4 [Cuculus canorus]